MVLDSLFPVFALMVLGAVLKRTHLTSDLFLGMSDRLVYFIFFPTLLFWKIGAKPLRVLADWNMSLAVLCAIGCTYLISCICIRLFRVTSFQAGSFSQSCYRFNTYIGMAILINTLGETGAGTFGILIGFAIPFINVLAVSTLIWYSGKPVGMGHRVRMTLTALVSNPLILACIAGIVYARYVQSFPVFLDNTFRLMAMVTLPLALISIGGALSVDSLRESFRVSMAAALVKLLVFPLIGYGFLRLFQVEALGFKIGMLFFALPTSPSIYVLSSQLNSDTRLASAAIVLSTALSIISLSVTLACFF